MEAYQRLASSASFYIITSILKISVKISKDLGMSE